MKLLQHFSLSQLNFFKYDWIMLLLTFSFLQHYASGNKSRNENEAAFYQSTFPIFCHNLINCLRFLNLIVSV